MSRWFRVYDDLVDDPKVQRLSGDMVKSLLNLWCLASQNDGMLPAADDIAFKLRLTPAKVAKLLSVLGECGLIDSDEEGLRPHNWNGRQYKSDVADPTAALRQKAYRERNKNRNGHRNATVTVTDTRADTEQITETEQKKKTRASALAEPWSEVDRNRFWEMFPNKVGKGDAMKAFDKATHKTAPDVLFQALLRYANKTDDRPFCNPATWLNQERWLDQPAANPNGRRTVQQAADDLLAKLRSFDEPAPSGLCDGEGQNPVRLLPPR
jgi:DNA-binding transcriptional ArsR family regulator